MNNIAEEPFIINGVRSWIHCLECNFSKTNEQTPVPYHYHDYIELLYALNADAHVWCNGEKCSFRPGDLVIINSKEPHTLTFNKNSSYICIKFLPQILYADENSLFELRYVLPFLRDNSHQQVFHKDELRSIDVHSLVLEIMDEWQSKGPAFELIIRANILKIFTGIFRYWHNVNILPGETGITDTLKKALKYVSENFDTVTEYEVAKYCSISYTHFSHIFKKTMGKTFKEYITFLRLREAEKLLLSTDESIAEIAATCGFSSSSYFISKFRNLKGITPRQFRENTRYACIKTDFDF